MIFSTAPASAGLARVPLEVAMVQVRAAPLADDDVARLVGAADAKLDSGFDEKVAQTHTQRPVLSRRLRLRTTDGGPD